MNLTDFQNTLLKNYGQHHGPFNWLASDYDGGISGHLSSTNKRAALILVYTKYADTIGMISNDTTPIEKILLSPTKEQDLFELIVCTTLGKLKQNNKEGLSYSVGEHTLCANRDDLSLLIRQFENLKKDLNNIDWIWIEDCIQIWGRSTLDAWIDRQISFIHCKLTGRSELKGSHYSSSMHSDVVSLNSLSVADAQKKLNDMVGMTKVKTNVQNLLANMIYSEARIGAYALEQQRMFKNIIISGAPGVGKTTSAHLIAGVLAASGILKEKKAVFTTIGFLIGEYIGMTEKNIKRLFDKGSGGAIIIDEADTLASDYGGGDSLYYISAINTLNALIGYEKDNNTGTVVILTGYDAGLKRLLTKNEGLRRRFPNYISIPDYNIDTLKDVLEYMLKSRAYNFSADVLDASMKQIMIAKDYMGNAFGNAGSVEEFIGVLETGRARKIGVSNLRDILENKTYDPSVLSTLSDLTTQDVPRFDKTEKLFVPSYLTSILKTQNVQLHEKASMRDHL